MAMQDGMKKRAASATDKSMSPPAGRVNDSAVRSGVAATPKTLGPRTA